MLCIQKKECSKNVKDENCARRKTFDEGTIFLKYKLVATEFDTFYLNYKKLIH